jgi:hypothetical protein
VPDPLLRSWPQVRILLGALRRGPAPGSFPATGYWFQAAVGSGNRLSMDVGWIIVVIVGLVILVGAGYGLLTRAGSGIEEHPRDDVDEAPGTEGRSEATGRDEGEGSVLDTHGTR